MNATQSLRRSRVTAGLLTLLSTINYQTSTFAQSSAFTYQGRLNATGAPANGTYDLVFSIYASPNGTGDVFAFHTNSATGVTNGLFTVPVDFGPYVFSGEDRWLQIDVRTNGSGAFAPLSPRQKLTPTPYAITAENVISGGLAGAYTNAINLNNPANSFAGNGGALTNVNAATIGGLGTNDFWRAKGNAGTTAGMNFLGTADNQPLELQVNSTRALRIEPHATSASSLAGGYYQNSVAGFYGAVVAGGGTSAAANGVSGNYAFIGAGYGANAGNNSAVVAGAYNKSAGAFGFVGSGLNNNNLADYSFIGSGTNNYIVPSATYSYIGGGAFNVAASPWDVVGGGYSNSVSGSYATVGGGLDNIVANFYATISGGYINQASGPISVIGGGEINTASGYLSTVGGGFLNVAAANGATVAGGEFNAATGTLATVTGGSSNQATNDYAAVGGGLSNTAGARSSTVGGGENNLATGQYATVAGGGQNTVGGAYATVPGGYENMAGGLYSLAAGKYAQALHQGSFVWADSLGVPLASTASDQFLVRANGGVGINKNDPTSTLDVNGTSHIQGVNNWDVTGTEGDFRVGNDSYRFKLGVAIAGAGAGDVWMRAHGGTGRVFLKTPGGTTIYSNEGQTNGVSLAAGGGAWSSVSDRNAKENFDAVDTQEILQRVASLPVSTWNYKSQDKNIRHIGPMAQDFASAFHVGEDDKHITTIDADGVALAAIKGLNQKLEAKDERIRELEERLSALEQLVRNHPSGKK